MLIDARLNESVVKPDHNASKRIAGLDVIRAFAIIIVVFAHSIGFIAPLKEHAIVGKTVRFITENAEAAGILGVELFFVLSGFLIGTILIRQFLKAPFDFKALKTFWIRRWYRTIPLYWLILTVNIFLFKALKLQGLEPYKLLFYPFLQNLWYPNPQWFFGEAWSLSIEEWFYISLPLCLFIASTIGRQANKKRLLFRIFIGYALVFISIRFANAFAPLNDVSQDQGIRKVVLFRLDAVMYGVLMAYAYTYRKAFLKKYQTLLLAFSVFSFVLFYVLLSSANLDLANAKNATVRFLSDALLYLCIPMSLSLCLPYARGIISLRSKRLQAAVTYISKISYSMYLVHFTLLYIAFFVNLRPVSGKEIVAYYLLYWFTVLALSSLLYKIVELPFLRYRDRKYRSDKDS